MTNLGAQIIAIAQAYHDRQCVETSTNRGPCVDELHRIYDGRTSPDPWCAIAVYSWTKLAADKLGIRNILPQTAGARDMLNRSNKVANLRVDQTPAPGAVFYRRSTAKGATGHMGIVSSVEPWGIRTIEGNHNDRVLEYNYKNEHITDPVKEFRFIHVEEMPGARSVRTAAPATSAATHTPSTTSGSGVSWPLLLAAGAGIYLLTQ